ncbi:UNVERIFIED_CONTAM: hypothetical protein PYX00_005877 [Menopon gallinae]|uniref:Lipase n=1 Tax=Menopon gallinae TaxID=328185 RepID=A0AAW2HV47_9NEOP
MYRALFTLILTNICVITLQTDCAGEDPDIYLSTPQIIRRHGYPSEAHVVRTEDGYLLTLHRIPYGRISSSKPKKVAFLQHGLLSSSADWILNGPNRSLAYVLADQNFDVWLGNARGNTYSRAHVSLLSDDLKFWNFTWHEMGVRDLPAVIDYILNKTNQRSLFYVGHSMGTTMFFAMASTKPEYGSKVKGMFAMAPVTYVGHIKSPIRFLAPWAKDIRLITNFFGDGAFLPNNKVMQFLTKYGCEILYWEKEICTNIIFVLCGFDRAQFNMSMLPLLLSHSPAGTSSKTVVHYAQEVNSGKFRQFDYGKLRNMEIYGTTDPPEYNISAIKTPIALFYATNDWLAHPIDVQHFYEQLKNKIGKFLVKYPGFNHLDFVWGKDAKTLVYDQMIKIMKTL